MSSYRYCKKEQCWVKVRRKQPIPAAESLPFAQDMLSTVLAALLSACMLVGLWSLSRDNYVPPAGVSVPLPPPPPVVKRHKELTFDQILREVSDAAARH